jgi:hypothetical protein
MRVEHQDGHYAALEQLVKDYVTAQGAEVPEDLPTPIYNRIRALVPAA